MTKQEEIITWEYEDCDNGCIIRDLGNMSPECMVALRDLNLPDSDENIHRLLGKWLYSEILAYMDMKLTSKVKVSIKIEDNERGRQDG